MISFSGAHYVSYVRNLKTKVQFVAESQKDLSRMEKEVRPETEWTLFDDSKVLSVTGHWKDIVSDCVTAKI